MERLNPSYSCSFWRVIDLVDTCFRTWYVSLQNPRKALLKKLRKMAKKFSKCKRWSGILMLTDAAQLVA